MRPGGRGKEGWGQKPGSVAVPHSSPGWALRHLRRGEAGSGVRVAPIGSVLSQLGPEIFVDAVVIYICFQTSFSTSLSSLQRNIADKGFCFLLGIKLITSRLPGSTCATELHPSPTTDL